MNLEHHLFGTDKEIYFLKRFEGGVGGSYTHISLKSS